MDALKLSELYAKLRPRILEAFGKWISWSPTIAWNGTAPSGLSSDSSFRYCVIGRMCIVNGYAIYTTQGSGNTLITVTLPISPTGSILAQAASAMVSNATTQNLTRAHIRRTSDDLYITCNSVSANRLSFNAMYEI